ncbi:MAG TPA: VOC family protein [Edaphobacter sp.]|nr:VOC family protein [Edaphobacter sp.]
MVRPRITGISHVAYYVSDLPKALIFWHDLLGFDVPYSLKNADGGIQVAFVKINDREHIELVNAPPPNPPNRMSHLCFSVDNIEQMRAYLLSQGYEVPAIQGKTRTGDYAFTIKDPDGTRVEFVQTLPEGMEAKAAGKFEPSTRISEKIMHVGFIVGNTQKSLDFYGRVLGFQETWRGTPNPKELSWINMRVPDGTDYVEFMLYRGTPTDMGGKNHTSLIVPDAARAMATLESRPAFKEYSRPVKINIGINRKRQVNLFDPDGTRVELMEPVTIDGKPAVSSTAPPPPPAHD